jgi:hypothetical protein
MKEWSDCNIQHKKMAIWKRRIFRNRCTHIRINLKLENQPIFFFSKQEWGKLVTWMYTCIRDFYQNNLWNKCEEKHEIKVKEKTQVISFYIWIDLILITTKNIPPKLIYELVQVNSPLVVITYLSFQTFSPWLCCCPSSLQTYQRLGHGNSNS